MRLSRQVDRPTLGLAIVIASTSIALLIIPQATGCRSNCGGMWLVYGWMALQVAVPYAMAVMMSRTSMAWLRTARLFLILYAVVDIIVRVRGVLFPERLEYAFAVLLLPILFGPVALAIAAAGAALWRISGRRGLAGWVAINVAIAAAVYVDLFVVEPQRMVRDYLHLDHLPTSVRVKTCAETGFQETVVSRYLEVDPGEFSQLLGGRRYEQHAESAFAHKYWKHLGPDFRLAVQFSATWVTTDPRYKQGHSTSVFADAARHRVVMDDDAS